MAQTSQHLWLARLALVWRLGIVVLGAFGLYLGFDPFSGNPNTGMFHFFTNLSNAAAVLYFLCALVAMVAPEYRPGRNILWRVLKNMLMMSVLVTMLIAQFLLNGVMQDGKVSPSLFLLHLTVPLMVFLDWLFFDAKGRVAVWEPIAWLVLPLVYLAQAMLAAPYTPIRLENGTYVKYPYGFLDIDLNGAGKVAVTVVVLLVLFTLLGYVLYGLDRLLGTVFGRNGRP